MYALIGAASDVNTSLKILFTNDERLSLPEKKEIQAQIDKLEKLMLNAVKTLHNEAAQKEAEVIKLV